MREYAFIGVRIARAFEFDRDAQADLLQEIFLQWWRSIPKLRHAKNPKPWLYSVSLNVAITWQRREARHGRVINRAAPFAQLVENVAQPFDSIDRHAIDELYGAIQQLRPAERALIILHLDGLSYEEIGSTLGVSANAVGSRLTRARANLGKILKGVKNGYERV